jgi:uncharacterized protein
MREEIQQVCRKKKSGKKTSLGVVPIAEGTSFTKASHNDTSSKDCCNEAAGSREAIEKTTAESGIIRRVFKYLNPKNLLIVLVKLYRLCISPWFSPCCRFQPSCSSYAQEALEEYGLMKGLSLSFLRIIRCHPFCKGGHDPVPPKKASNASQLNNIRGLKS